MTDIEINYNRDLDKPCTDNNIEEYINDKHISEDITNFSIANVIPDILCNLNNEQNNEQINVENDNISIVQGNICKPVSVMLIRLSEEMYKKYMSNKIKKRRSSKFKSIERKLKQTKQSNILHVLNNRNAKVSLNNDFTSVDIENQVEETSLQLDNQRENKKSIVQKLDIFPSISRYTLRSRSTLKNMRLMYSIENLKDDNFINDKFNQISSKKEGETNKEVDLSLKEKYQRKKHLDKWKYKRKSNDICSEESDNISNISKNARKKRRKTELSANKNNKKIKRSELLSQSTYPNITDTRVILTKLEDMHNNKYATNWRKKLSQQTSSVKTVDSSHKDITKDNEHNINIKRSLIPYVFKSKYKQIANLKVLLVKLETLGVLLKEQNTASKIEHLTAKYNDMYKLNVLTYSNITAYSDESKSAPIREENDVVNEDEDEENIKYPRVSGQEIYVEEENSILSLPKVAERLQVEDTSQGTLTSQTSVQKSPKKISDNSPSKEINMLLLSNNELKRTLKKIQILPFTISSEENIYLKKSTRISNSKDINNCEIIDVLQNKNEKPMLQKNYELNDVISSSKSAADQCSSTSESVSVMEDDCSLVETCLSKESGTTDCDIITEVGVSQTSSSNDLTEEVQEVNEFQPIIVDSERVKQSINTSFLYSCISCNSSFKQFPSLSSHLKDCLVKSQEKKNTYENNVKLNVSIESVQPADTTSDNFTTDRNVKSPLILMSNSLAKSNTSSIKALRQKWKRNRMVKEQLQNSTSIKCNICSKVFDTMENLSNHIYNHTEAELQKAYEILKTKQNCESTSDKIDEFIANSTERTQASTNELLNTLVVEENTAEQSETISENINDESETNKVVSTEETRSKDDVPNKLLTVTKSYKQPPSTYPKKPMTFCECHKIDDKSDSIELVLLCNICNVIFRTKECFEGHFENSGSSMCNTKRLTGRIPKLYCSVCHIILYSFVDMRRHAETHIKNDQRIKLLCHICKVRFIGMGPIFNLHWFNHMRNVCYTATAANFPKTALVDYKSKAWSIITNDEFKYLVVTEHVCNFCNVQFLSTNQLQSHISVCPKRMKSVSEAVVVNNERNQSNELESNLRLFCSLCNLTFLEKSSFEAHAMSHKQHLQPQYICLSVTDIKRIYICNVCANVYDNLKEFMTHWQDHNAIRENFMCNHCKQNFFTLETFVDHSKQCNVSAIPVDVPSCEVTYRETNFSCKICNIGFESSKALYQHSGIHNVRFSGVNVACPNDIQAKSTTLEVSSSRSNNLEPELKQTATTSRQTINQPPAEVTTTDDNVNKNTPETSTSTDITSTRSEFIDSSKPLFEQKLGESLESDFDSASMAGNQSITDAETEILSSISEASTDNLTVTEEQTFCEGTNNLEDPTNITTESNEVIGGSNVDDSLPETKVSNSKEKRSNEISSTTKDVNASTSDAEDDVILIEPEVTNKKKENTTDKSLAKTTTTKNDILLEALTKSGIESSEPSNPATKSVKVTKYLRVKNIAELIDQRLKYLCPVCNIYFDSQEGLKTHSVIHNSVQQGPPANVPSFSSEPISEKSKEQTGSSLNTLNSSNLQQNHMVYIPVSNMSIQQPNYTSYIDPGTTTRYLLKPPPPYTAAYTIPTTVVNTQYPNISDMNNIDNRIKPTGTFVPSANVQAPNLLVMEVLQPPNTQNSSENLVNNNYPTQTSNAVSTIRSTYVQPANSPISNENSKKMQECDAHNRVKLKNTVYDGYTNRAPTVVPTNSNSVINNNLAIPVNTNQQGNVSLPKSSNQYQCYDNISNLNYSSPSGSTMHYIQQNPPLTTNNSQGSTSQAQMSIFYQPTPVPNTISLPQQQQEQQQQHTVHHRPNVNSASCRALFICHFCPNIRYFLSHQELDNHLHIEHNYLG